MKNPLYWIKRLLWVLTGVALLVAVFYLEEDWRGGRELARVVKDLRDRGEPMTSAELFQGKPNVDLSKDPVFVDLFAADPFRSEAAPVCRINLPRPKTSFKLPRFVGFARGVPYDLKGWSLFFHDGVDSGKPPEQDILDSLSKWESDLASVAAAVSKDGARWPVAYERGLEAKIPFTLPALNVSLVWEQRGIALLATGQTDAAKGDFMNIANMAATMRHTPLLVDALFYKTLWVADLGLLWQGLHFHVWKEKDLIEIESRLARESPLGAFVESLQGEQVFCIGSVSTLEKRRWSLAWWMSWWDREEWDLRPTMLIWCSDGWIKRGAADFLKSLDETSDLARLRNGRIDDKAFVPAPRKEEDESLRTALHDLFHATDVFQIGVERSLLSKSIRLETEIRLARIACFLERYRLHHGAYPETLAAMVDL
ncbi:MAG TPA: hypothetical protein VIM58_04120, partial [Candidatus Methylacidiphilales bacterium]